MELTSVTIVEDDEHKLRQLLEFLQIKFPSIKTRTCKSFSSGLASILQDPPSFVLLDMTLPTFDVGSDEEGGRPRPYGGRELLEHIEESEVLIPALIVTQYTRFGSQGESLGLVELDHQLAFRFQDFYVGIIYYSASVDSWKAELANAINKLLET